MISVIPTKNLLGVTIQGDYGDFYQLTRSIHNLSGYDAEDDLRTYGVMMRLLGLCYDIRHAYQGDRNVLFVDNNMYPELQDFHDITCSDKNAYFSVEVFFPEIIFLACSVPTLYRFCKENYGKAMDVLPAVPLTQYYLDVANLNFLFASVWQAIGEVIGEEDVMKIRRSYDKNPEDYTLYTTQFVDKCNIEYYKTNVSKRKDKLRIITKRIVSKTGIYYDMEENFEYWAEKYKTSIYELSDPKLEYPEEVEWE
ncbi:DUF6904 family protein [Tannockella kyphosi]|uniref:DUF6904 family protein n=1 Tax=Tannockella kyphosi TaxID=2899121 RepID=UPI0020125BBD|nr:hypothetical protein [Tannockella kyphosi]